MATKKEPMSTLHMKIPADLKRALEEIAAEERRSLTVTVTMALEALVAARPGRKGITAPPRR